MCIRDSGWRASVSSATSFRVPTLYQRFSKYGVSTLQPETGRNLELGLNYAEAGNSFGVSVYRNQLTNLLAFLSGAPASVCPVPATGCYANTAEAQYQGVTLSAQRVWGVGRVWGSLDLQDPRDRVTGKLLQRRATHHATLGLQTRALGWTLGGDLLLSAQRYDDAANTTVLPAYAVLNLFAQNRLGREWSLLLRVDNATDAKYQLAAVTYTHLTLPTSDLV